MPVILYSSLRLNLINPLILSLLNCFNACSPWLTLRWGPNGWTKVFRAECENALYIEALLKCVSRSGYLFHYRESADRPANTVSQQCNRTFSVGKLEDFWEGRGRSYEHSRWRSPDISNLLDWPKATWYWPCNGHLINRNLYATEGEAEWQPPCNQRAQGNKSGGGWVVLWKPSSGVNAGQGSWDKLFART